SYLLSTTRRPRTPPLFPYTTLFRSHVQHQADTGRQRFQEPDVRHRAGQFDVTHALAAHFGERHFNAALLADHATVLEALVFAARSEEHTSELQSRENLVCRLLLEKK